MRRVLEAYSTFNFKIGIKDLSTNKKIIGRLENSHQKYFENSMYRFVLHGESHTGNKVQYGVDFYDSLNVTQKQRTAKDVLMFLYLLDHFHVERHLNDKNGEKCRQIESWIKEI